MTGRKTARPPPIKPLDPDVPRTDEEADKTARDEPAAGGQPASTFPKTTTAMVGWAQSLTPELKKVQPLERHARPLGDIRKTFGWPPDGE